VRQIPEHIDRLIFDYYEGNLSPSEKVRALSIIHEHPEYSVAFVAWAQSYAHIDTQLTDYELTEKLIKPATHAWYASNTWITFSISAVIICLLSLCYLIYSFKEKNKIV